MKDLKRIQNQHGSLPAYAWPGGYTLIYGTRGDELLCWRCATHHRREVTWYGTHDEGSPEECGQCGYPLLATYGDPEGIRYLVEEEGFGEREAEIMVELNHESLSLAWEQDRLANATAWKARPEKIAVLQQRVDNMTNSLQNRQHRLAEVREGREIPWTEWLARA
jgi:hypothetical protein